MTLDTTGTGTAAALMAAAGTLPGLAAPAPVRLAPVPATARARSVSGASGPRLLRAIPDQRANEGSRFRYQIPVATFVDSSSRTLTWSVRVAGGSAPWLRFDAQTRTLSGTVPRSAPDLSIVVTAINRRGLWNQDTFTLRTPTPAKTRGTPTADRLAATLAQGAAGPLANAAGGWPTSPTATATAAGLLAGVLTG